MHITKMHGLGNDYIYLNGLEGAPEDLPCLLYTSDAADE